MSSNKRKASLFFVPTHGAVSSGRGCSLALPHPPGLLFNSLGEPQLNGSLLPSVLSRRPFLCAFHCLSSGDGRSCGARLLPAGRALQQSGFCSARETSGLAKPLAAGAAGARPVPHRAALRCIAETSRSHRFSWCRPKGKLWSLVYARYSFQGPQFSPLTNSLTCHSFQANKGPSLPFTTCGLSTQANPKTSVGGSPSPQPPLPATLRHPNSNPEGTVCTPKF